MKSILKIITHNVIDKVLLEKEFSSYDDKRPEAIEIVFEFEKAAYSKYPELEELVLSENHFDFGTLLRELQAKKVLSQNDGYYLSQIRNAFSHNSYPRNLRITSNIPEIAQEMINIFRITTTFVSIASALRNRLCGLCGLFKKATVKTDLLNEIL